MKKRILILVLLGLLNISFAQKYVGYCDCMLIYKAPSTEADAMGQISSVKDRSNYLTFMNPAALTDEKGISVSYGKNELKYNEPEYSLGDLKYNNFNIAYTNEKYGSIAFSYYHENCGDIYTTTVDNPDGDREKYEIGTKIYSLGYAYNIDGIFSVGLTGNLAKR